MAYTVAQVHRVQNDKGEVGLSKCAARRLLGIRSRDTFIKHCQALRYGNLEYFYLEHLRQIFTLCLFVSLGGYRHSRKQFLKYQRVNLLDRKFAQRNINLQEQLRRLEDDYLRTIRS